MESEILDLEPQKIGRDYGEITAGIGNPGFGTVENREKLRLE